MERLKKAKLAIDAIPCYASKMTPKSSTSTINQFSTCSSSSCKSSSQFYSSSIFNRFSLPSKMGKNRNQFMDCRRYYYVDRYGVHHFKPRGLERWFQNPTTVLLVVLVFVGSAVSITVYFGLLEKVPYTKRNRFVLVSKSLERDLGECKFDQIKEKYKGKFLPEIHPKSVRVCSIAKEIIEALQRGLKRENVWTDSGFGNADETLEIQISKFCVQLTIKRDQEKGWIAQTSHLDGLNWEVLVVDYPEVNAFCLPGGKIVVFTGWLDHFKTDTEIATIIAHEVGHVVARHPAEKFAEYFWFEILRLAAYLFGMPHPYLVKIMIKLFLRLPFSRRMEIEADSIGLLLMASAGYDPREAPRVYEKFDKVAPQVYEKLGKVAPRVYEKLGKLADHSVLDDYLSTHPSGKKRAKLLAEAKVMEEALAIYRGPYRKGIEGFLKFTTAVFQFWHIFTFNFFLKF